MKPTTVDRLERVLVRLPAVMMPVSLANGLARLIAPGLSVVLGLETRGVEQRLRGLLWSIRHHSPRLRVGRNVSLFPRHRVSLGADVGLGAGAVLDACGPRGRIDIGERTHVDCNSILYGQGGIRIGAGCAIASGVIVYSQSNRYDVDPERPILDQGTRYAEVTVGDDVWIGAGAILLPGVTIGDHAVVAAGAVVRGSVEPWSVVAGVPARRIKDRREGVAFDAAGRE